MIPKSTHLPVAAVSTNATSIIHGIGPQKCPSTSSSTLRRSSSIALGP